ncbi:hypothetical protein ACQEU5_21650 [Marinactinospora thermotolerans]|uniref:Uncharacterized protein n=1 Tax=Marinactinospora thermotolerans DSM 45154 TaxID=1122192 RepID=A0A1T4PBD3_9ACTN|nr:hypothetical protein [Marinactinospora thermotolerans]SJZ88691.1 hypothetical protein SAMN02745673_01713 [Marinactinospora thermotolerans DSM 45154]
MITPDHAGLTGVVHGLTRIGAATPPRLCCVRQNASGASATTPVELPDPGWGAWSTEEIALAVQGFAEHLVRPSAATRALLAEAGGDRITAVGLSYPAAVLTVDDPAFAERERRRAVGGSVAPIQELERHRSARAGLVAAIDGRVHMALCFENGPVADLDPSREEAVAPRLVRALVAVAVGVATVTRGEGYAHHLPDPRL